MFFVFVFYIKRTQLFSIKDFYLVLIHLYIESCIQYVVNYIIKWERKPIYHETINERL